MTRSAQLGRWTWPEVDGTGVVLLVPIGATEQHGHHLPLDTDTRIAQAVADSVALDRPPQAGDAAHVVTAPAISYGASGEHEGFAGTISVGHEALELLLVEYGRSACRWARRLVFINGHGGNVPTLIEAVTRLRYEGRDVAWFPCAPAGGDAHAGRTETSMMMAVAAADVRPVQASAGNTAPLESLMKDIRAHGVRFVSPSGVLGDPAGAEATEGSRLVGGLVRALTRRLAAWEPDEQGMLR